MSTAYNVEPQPTAKVLLKTTVGDIVVELFAKQIPLASRNFLQHCLDGYYDNALFHRLVPGFILQGGDPTGLGTGGESAMEHGAPFADEFHSRLRFNRRGLLGMANSGQKDDNLSQFFFTLDKTPELQGRNTMFGRIEGDTIYNLMKMSEAELAEEGGDRPLYPSRILSAEILVNPFVDMVKRTRVETITQDDKKTKKKRKTGKVMLSFGVDDGEDEPITKKAKVNPSLHTEEAATTGPKIKPLQQETAPKRSRRKSSSSESSVSEHGGPVISQQQVSSGSPRNSSSSTSPSPSPERRKAEISALDRTNAEIAALKASMRRGTNGPPSTKQEKPKASLESFIPANATRGRKRGRQGGDESKSLDAFEAFRARLGGAGGATQQNTKKVGNDATREPAGKGADDGDAEEEELCDLHFVVNCDSCRAWIEEDNEDEDAEDDDPNWMAHTLSFAKDTLGKDLEWRRKMEEYEEIDSRNEQRTGKSKDGERWTKDDGRGQHRLNGHRGRVEDGRRERERGKDHDRYKR